MGDGSLVPSHQSPVTIIITSLIVTTNLLLSSLIYSILYILDLSASRLVCLILYGSTVVLVLDYP